MKKAFDPIVTVDSKILILGTMPGERSLELQQYYGHSNNQFWKIMFSLFGEPFTTNYDDRIRLVVSRNIALWDVISECERDGSADNKIKNEVVNDFKTFFKTYPNIKAVFLDSNTAHKLYKKHVGQEEYIKFYPLPSTSARYAAMSYEQKLKEWAIILDVLKL